ncbi:MAG: class I SAM-dependent methyltransferase [Acidobacteria bacterium]|nr:class I SAM-dependent methyltransferase [Acidobacteriota bacterium]
MLLPKPSLVARVLGRSARQMTLSQSESLDIHAIRKMMEPFRKTLRAVKDDISAGLTRPLAPDMPALPASPAGEFAWYPYESLMNFYPLEQLLRDEDRYFLSMAGGEPVLDLGCGDGDVSLFLESLGSQVHAVDFPPTNFNNMRGVRALKDALQSSLEIFEADLDDRFTLPAPRYGLAFFCGILYHLKNPYYALETLARHARYCVLSTRARPPTTPCASSITPWPICSTPAKPTATRPTIGYFPRRA